VSNKFVLNFRYATFFRNADGSNVNMLWSPF